MKLSYSDLSPRQVQLFRAKVLERGPDECWPFVAKSVERNGRGKHWINKTCYTANRVAYVIFNRTCIDDDAVIGHSCNNANCCNPSHLYECTQDQNIEYMNACGRRYPVEVVNLLRRGNIPAEKQEYLLQKMAAFELAMRLNVAS